MTNHKFRYTDCRFADIQMLRFRLKDFEKLTLQQKTFIYYLSKAAIAGRDIIFDQNCKYNLIIRKLLEAIYNSYSGNRETKEFQQFKEYLYRVWFSNGIHHHYSCDKFMPEFSPEYLSQLIDECGLRKDLNVDWDVLKDVIYNKTTLSKRVNQSPDEDIVTTSACNFYEGVTQKEVEHFYSEQKNANPNSKISWGLNSKVVKRDGKIVEEKWCIDKTYGKEITEIVKWLTLAKDCAENKAQQEIIDKLICFYRNGNLEDFDDYSISWVSTNEGIVDFINGFIEVYGDPLGMKGTWEGLVEYVDTEATERTNIISSSAQWFEDHSPIDPRFKRDKVKGVTARVVCAAMLGGEEYPASAIGINLPNANWIRATYGSKSVTIGNLTEAYAEAARGNGFRNEFIDDKEMIDLIDNYGHVADDLHTDLHECLGHGSGKLLPSTDPDALKAYGNTIEEARADLFALYYIADKKLVELSLLPTDDAYKANYYSFMLNGLLTQTVRIEQGKTIEEAHMRNRALIAWWVVDHANGMIRLENKDGKTFLKIDDYNLLRQLFAQLLKEIQRIKSEGDYDAARELVEKYAVKIDPTLHNEILTRYRQLNIAPYRGFINPQLIIKRDDNGKILDVEVDYTETYEHQMMRYSGYYPSTDCA